MKTFTQVTLILLATVILWVLLAQYPIQTTIAYVASMFTLLTVAAVRAVREV